MNQIPTSPWLIVYKDYEVDSGLALEYRAGESISLCDAICDIWCDLLTYPTGLFPLDWLIKASFLVSYLHSRKGKLSVIGKDGNSNSSIYFPVQLLIVCQASNMNLALPLQVPPLTRRSLWRARMVKSTLGGVGAPWFKASRGTPSLSFLSTWPIR